MSDLTHRALRVVRHSGFIPGQKDVIICAAAFEDNEENLFVDRTVVEDDSATRDLPCRGGISLALTPCSALDALMRSLWNALREYLEEWWDMEKDQHVKIFAAEDRIDLPGGAYVLALGEKEDPAVEIEFIHLFSEKYPFRFRVKATIAGRAGQKTYLYESFGGKDAEACHALFELLVTGTRRDPWDARLSFKPDGHIVVNGRIFRLPGAGPVVWGGKGTREAPSLPERLIPERRMRDRRGSRSSRRPQPSLQVEDAKVFFKTASVGPAQSPVPLGLGGTDWEQHALLRQSLGEPQKARGRAGGSEARGRSGSPMRLMSPDATRRSPSSEAARSKRPLSSISTDIQRLPDSRNTRARCLFGTSCPRRRS